MENMHEVKVNPCDFIHLNMNATILWIVKLFGRRVKDSRKLRSFGIVRDIQFSHFSLGFRFRTI
jgi:hypothetical protein